VSDNRVQFSIIVPIYNVEKYLEKCIESIINQTYSNIEIILVDDGSTDNCPKICDEYREKDCRIKVLHKQNGGLSDARNEGLNIANGEYVLFVDSDDYLEKDACENFSAYLDKSADILIGDGLVIGGCCDISHINESGTYKSYDFMKKSLSINKFPKVVWLNAYRRKFLCKNDLSFKKGILHEDENFTPRAFLCADIVIYTKISFYNYLIRENSITTQKNKTKNAIDVYDTCLELYSIYKTLPDKKLKRLLLDDLAVIYLNMFQVGKLYQYGKEFIHKQFLIKTSKRFKTKLKAILFIISPKLYYKLNKFTKREK